MGILKNILKKLLITPKVSTNETTPIPPEDPQPKLNIKKHKVAGVKYYINNVMTFAKPNPDYSLNKNEMIKRELDKRIYQYVFYSGKTELIPEPANPYNPNAVKVVIDGKHVGYIKDGSCKHILNLINEDRIEKIDSEIYGGKYKKLGLRDGDLILENGDSEYKINVIIIER